MKKKSSKIIKEWLMKLDDQGMQRVSMKNFHSLLRSNEDTRIFYIFTLHYLGTNLKDYQINIKSLLEKFNSKDEVKLKTR